MGAGVGGCLDSHSVDLHSATHSKEGVEKEHRQREKKTVRSKSERRSKL